MSPNRAAPSVDLISRVGLVGAHEVEREAAHDGHVLGAVACAVARQIVLELDVEQPVHAFDAPMAADAAGEPFDVERCGADIKRVSNVHRSACSVAIETVRMVLMFPKRGWPG